MSRRITLSTNVTPELYQLLLAEAKDSERSISQLLRVAVKNYISRKPISEQPTDVQP